MTNIILPVIDDFEGYAALVKELKIPDAHILVGVTEAGAQAFKFRKAGMRVTIYKDGSAKEEIINALQSQLEDGKTLIMRKKLSKQEVAKFLDSKADITVCDKKPRNKFSEFFYNLWKKIIRLMFDLTFFDGDVSAVAFSENLSGVIQNISNLSYASRINRWKGVSEGAVQTSSKPAKKEYSRLKNNVMLIGWTALFLAVVASTAVYFLFEPATFLAGFLWTCAIVISSLCLILAVVIYIMNIKTGKRHFKKAEEV